MGNPASISRERAQAKWPGANVVNRGRSWIQHQHPIEPWRYMLDNHLHPIHYGAAVNQEIDTAWEVGGIEDQPWFWKMVKNDFNVFLGPGTMEFNAGQIVKYVHQNGAEITFEPQQLQWTNDLDQIEAIADPQQVTHSSLMDDTVTWSGAFGPGLDFEWRIYPTRLSKFLTVDQLSSIGAPPQYIVDGGNPVLRLQFIIQKSAGVEIWIDDTLWNETGQTNRTANNVEFREAGSPVWYFSPPIITDAAGVQLTATQRFRTVGPNLFVEVLVPWSWLEAAAYPVTIDPTIEEDVSAGADDFRWYETSGTFQSGTDALAVGLPDSGVTGPANSGMHFKNVSSSLNGATVTTAYVIMTSSTEEISSACRLKVQAVDAQNPTTPTTYNEAENATRTTALNSWTAELWAVDGEYNTAEAKTIIQELIDSYDYSSGTGSILMYVEDNSSNNTHDRYPVAYDIDPTKSGVLHVEYAGPPSVPGGPQNWLPIRR